MKIVFLTLIAIGLGLNAASHILSLQPCVWAVPLSAGIIGAIAKFGSAIPEDGEGDAV